MKHIITVIFLVIGLSTSLFAQESDKYLQKGLDLFSKDDFKGSVELFTKSIAQKPTNQTYLNRAKAYKELDKYDAALSDLNQILLTEPLNVDALELKTYVHYLADDYQSMSNVIPKNIKLGIETKHNNYHYLSVAYDELGKVDSALIFVGLHLSKYPNDIVALYHRSNININKIDLKSALVDLNKIVEVDSTFADAYFTRGFVKSLQSEYQSALPDINRAEKLGFEALIFLYETRGDVYKELGDSLKAAVEYDAAISQAKEPDYDLIFKRGKLAYYQLEDNQTAIDLMSKIIQGASEIKLEVYYIRACALRDLKQLDKSEADFKKIEELSPKSNSFYVQWALLKVEQKEWNKAIDYANKTLSIQKGTDYSKSLAMYIIGRSLYEQKSTIESSKKLTEALELNNENSEAHYWLGKVLIDLNQKDEACEHFIKAYQIGIEEAKMELINHCDYTEESFEDDEG